MGGGFVIPGKTYQIFVLQNCCFYSWYDVLYGHLPPVVTFLHDLFVQSNSTIYLHTYYMYVLLQSFHKWKNFFRPSPSNPAWLLTLKALSTTVNCRGKVLFQESVSSAKTRHVLFPKLSLFSLQTYPKSWSHCACSRQAEEPQSHQGSSGSWK